MSGNPFPFGHSKIEKSKGASKGQGSKKQKSQKLSAQKWGIDVVGGGNENVAKYEPRMGFAGS